MPPRDMTPKQIQQEVLYRLYRRRCWGAKYLPSESLISWLGQLVKDNSRKVRVVINDLVRIGLLISHKKGKTVSLNSQLSKEISDMLRFEDQA